MTRLNALERAERAKARAVKRALEQFAQESNRPLAEVEAEYKQHRLIIAEGARLYPGDADRQIAFVARQIGVDADELRAEMKKVLREAH